MVLSFKFNCYRQRQGAEARGGGGGGALDRREVCNEVGVGRRAGGWGARVWQVRRYCRSFVCLLGIELV
jgi:hypothetical protein